MSSALKSPSAARPSAARAQRSLLVVEDDTQVRERLIEGLTLDGYEAEGAADLGEARSSFSRGQHDLLLLDVSLPDGSGYELLDELRSGELCSRGRPREALPVLLVSGHAEEHDRIRGFERGCDDYVVKPFSFGELRGRIEAVLRRVQAVENPDMIDLGELTIDTRRRQVKLNRRELLLTDKEYALLVVLASDPERVFERGRLLADLWGYNPANVTRTLDAHACRLRAKLKPGSRKYVRNVWGVGYRLFAPELVD